MAEPTLDLTNPIVLGPLAGFIFAVFVYEVIVPGRSFRRLQEENKRLRQITENLVPLTARMVDVCDQHARILARNTALLEEIRFHLKQAQK